MYLLGLCWLSTDVSMSSNAESEKGVQLTQSGRAIIQKDSGFVLGLNRTTNDGDMVLFNGQGSNRGSIAITSGGVSYNTGSDYRLKENVVELTGAKARLQQLPVKRFNFIVDPGTHNEVDSAGNPVYQGIDQAKLVPLLTAALQEAFAEIAALTARVETLEAG